jgi:hypothetical protein
MDDRVQGQKNIGTQGLKFFSKSTKEYRDCCVKDRLFNQLTKSEN